jgi:serine/threonine-protein kinase HipA
MKQAEVRLFDRRVGIICETDEGFEFYYDKAYVLIPGAEAISLTLPIRNESYKSPVMFPFFDGLIPEGWLLEIVQQNWKLNPKDRMELLLTCCKDCLGAVSVERITHESSEK